MILIPPSMAYGLWSRPITPSYRFGCSATKRFSPSPSSLLTSSMTFNGCGLFSFSLSLLSVPRLVGSGGGFASSLSPSRCTALLLPCELAVALRRSVGPVVGIDCDCDCDEAWPVIRRGGGGNPVLMTLPAPPPPGGTLVKVLVALLVLGLVGDDGESEARGRDGNCMGGFFFCRTA
jgi:hypothetical protein